MSAFKEKLQEIKEAEAHLIILKKAAYEDAVKEVQEIINRMQIQKDDLTFPEGAPLFKKRAPARMKYRTAEGIAWNGKGSHPRVFDASMRKQGLNPDSKEDLATLLIQYPS